MSITKTKSTVVKGDGRIWGDAWGDVFGWLTDCGLRIRMRFSWNWVHLGGDEKIAYLFVDHQYTVNSSKRRRLNLICRWPRGAEDSLFWIWVGGFWWQLIVGKRNWWREHETRSCWKKIMTHRKEKKNWNERNIGSHSFDEVVVLEDCRFVDDKIKWADMFVMAGMNWCSIAWTKTWVHNSIRTFSAASPFCLVRSIIWSTWFIGCTFEAGETMQARVQMKNRVKNKTNRFRFSLHHQRSPKQTGRYPSLALASF